MVTEYNNRWGLKISSQKKNSWSPISLTPGADRNYDRFIIDTFVFKLITFRGVINQTHLSEHVLIVLSRQNSASSLVPRSQFALPPSLILCLPLSLCLCLSLSLPLCLYLPLSLSLYLSLSLPSLSFLDLAVLIPSKGDGSLGWGLEEWREDGRWSCFVRVVCYWRRGTLENQYCCRANSATFIDCRSKVLGIWILHEAQIAQQVWSGFKLKY